MPNTKSAAKRLRSNAKRHSLNVRAKARLKKNEKNLLAQLDHKNADEAKVALNEMFSQLDRAAKRNVIHQNKVDRKKSRLSAKFKMALEQ